MDIGTPQKYFQSHVDILTGKISVNVHGKKQGTVLTDEGVQVAPAAEDVWQKLKNSKDVESVHLATWPKAEKVDEKVLNEMEIVRNQCTTGNMIRKEKAIPLKQPLATFFVKDVLEKYADLIKEELNVKEIKQGSEVSFDTNITPELKREGDFREFLRSVQGLRKDADLSPSELVILIAPESSKELIKGFEDELKKTAGLKEIKFGGEEIRIDK
jgi:isoleucyl-tRNA synthetase